MKKKDTKENAEHGGQEGESREPAHRILMDQFEPHKIGDKGDDHRLIEERANNIRINLVNPLRFEDDAYYKEDGNRKEKLVKKRVDRFNPFCHILLDVKCCRSPQNTGGDLQNVSIEHFCFRRYGSAAKDDKDASESKGETHNFQKSQSIALKEKMSSDGYDKRTQVDKKHGAGGICVEQTEVNTCEFDSKHEAHHHPMEEHDVLMKYFFSPSETVDQSAN